MDKFDLLDYLLQQRQATTLLVDFISSMQDEDAYGFLFLVAEKLGLDLNLEEKGVVQWIKLATFTNSF